MQVAHFLDADLQPWAAALAAALFTDPAFPPAAAQYSHQVEGNDAKAEVASAGNNLVIRQAVWRRLDELARLGGAADAVLRAWRLPLREQLPLTPAEWQPAVIGSHAVSGVFQLRLPTASACRGAMHAVHDVHSLSLDFSRRNQSPTTTELKDIRQTLHAVATMPALRSVDVDLSRSRCTRIVEELSPALSNLPQLASLRLNGSRIGAAGAAALVPLLGALTALTALDLGRNTFRDDGAEALALALTRLPRLAALDLSWLSICVAGAATLVEPLGALTALTALDLSGNRLDRVTEDGVLPRALSCLSRLADLRLERTGIDGASAAALAERLGSLYTLTALSLCQNHFGCDGVQSLAPALRRLPRLASLDLADTAVLGAGTAALAVHLSALTTLTAVCLSGNQFLEESDEMMLGLIEGLPPALSCLSRLADLRLSSYSIEASDAAALAATLRRLTALTRLHLCGNQFHQNGLCAGGIQTVVLALSPLSCLAEVELRRNIDDTGAAGSAALALHLSGLTMLTALDLSVSRLGDDGAQAVVPALSCLSRLAHLDLGFNDIEAAGAAALAQPLAALTMLTALILSDNRVGDAGAEALAPALSRLSHLQLLWLSYSALSADGLEHLVPALACLPNLSELDLLRGNRSHGAEAQFRARLPGIRDIS